jgi:hypothetical protein
MNTLQRLTLLYKASEWIKTVRKPNGAKSVQRTEIQAALEMTFLKEMALGLKLVMTADFMHELADLVNGEYIVPKKGEAHIKFS